MILITLLSILYLKVNNSYSPWMFFVIVKLTIKLLIVNNIKIMYPDFAAVLYLSVSPIRRPLMRGTGRGERRNTSDCRAPDRPPPGALPDPSRSTTSRTSIMTSRQSLDCHPLGRGGFTQHSLRTTLPPSTLQM